jgi:hypothetical protein
LPRLRQEARARGIAGRVIFTGARNDVGAILKASRVFVSLNRVDNCWATTIAEAMYLGGPCVVSDGGQERRLFPHEDAACLVPQAMPRRSRVRWTACWAIASWRGGLPREGEGSWRLTGAGTISS